MTVPLGLFLLMFGSGILTGLVIAAVIASNALRRGYEL